MLEKSSSSTQSSHAKTALLCDLPACILLVKKT
jgi:hypothetical protein